jgi:hypothetical protein
MGRFRREALQTMDQAQDTMGHAKAAIAKADDRLDDAGELMLKLDALIGIGINILERFDRILTALEKNGLDVNPKINATTIPVGVNLSVEGE